LNNNKTLEKYLKKRSFHKLANPHIEPLKRHYNTFIVIPCYDEYDYIFKTLDSINNQSLKLLENTLVVVVINNSDKDSQIIKKNNQLTYQSIIKNKYFFEIIVLNSFDKNNAFNNNNAGVGVARKLGLDYCLNFIYDENSLLCSLDADTIISEKYLSTIIDEFKNKTNAAVVNFKHQKSTNSLIQEGIDKYELILKNIAYEIYKTGSPYGYVSMGSTVICNVKAYIACGGMPKNKATEDFYFLQSLAKYTKIKQIKEILVHPSSRSKQRVYLGTGYRMNQYKKGVKFKDLDYSQDSFRSIKIIIDYAEKYWKESYSKFHKSLKNNLDFRAINFLILKNIESIWINISENSKNKKQFMLFFHQWFDGLMIIQLLKKLNN